jgi:predicted DNA-binding transcriptional regulator AlpA
VDLKPWELLGPSQYILTASDVAAFLRVSEKTLTRMVAAGQFPTPQLISGTPTWSGPDVAAYLQLRGRVGSHDDEPEDKPRQRRTEPDK